MGNFLGDFFMEWNGRFRDDVRSFWRGDQQTVRQMAQRLFGSPDLYSHEEREPEQSVNFVSCHDGFTLNDLVTYEKKHNEANGERNRDGSDYNLSWNCGVEGPTHDPQIEALRNQQVKNLLATTLLSIGAPMISMGDEVRRTQLGNNNAYSQDNAISWFDWSLLEKHAEILSFTKKLINMRLNLTFTQRPTRDFSLNQLLRVVPATWHGTILNHPDWADHSHSLAVTVRSLSQRRLYHIILNAYWEPLEFELPPWPAEKGWRRLLDTAQPAPDELHPLETAPLINGNLYLAQPRSLVVLISG